MHWLSTTNPYQANTSGKVNLTNQALNTTSAALAVRCDQWLMAGGARASRRCAFCAGCHGDHGHPAGRPGLPRHGSRRDRPNITL